MENIVADALSRIKTNALLSGQPPAVDFAAVAKTQATEKDWGLCLNFLLETVLSASGMIDSLATGRILSTYA